MEKTVGIHRDKLLPGFARETFEHWFETKTKGRRETDEGEHRVVLFHTCFVNYNAPEIGKDAVEVMERNGCKIACPKMNCCGMPALDGGDMEFAKRLAANNVKTLLPFVERGYRIAAINPTCSLMLKREYPVLLNNPANPELAAGAKRISEATRDLSEFLFELRSQGRWDESYQSTPGGTIAYHVPCHLKMQAIGFRSRDLLRKIPGVKVRLVDQCSGHDGTWAMKKEFFQMSQKIGEKAFEEMKAAEAEIWASDCPLAAIQFEQATGKKPFHPIQIIARAYRKDGFQNPVVKPGESVDS